MIPSNEVIIVRRGHEDVVYPPFVLTTRKERDLTFSAINIDATVILPRSLYDEEIQVERGSSRSVALKSEAPAGVFAYSVRTAEGTEFAKAGSSPIIIIR